MLSDKQFDDAFTAAGGRFSANNYEYIADHIDLKSSELVDTLYLMGYDAAKSGTRTRISSSKRLIADNHGIRALKKVASSERIQKDAVNNAKRILSDRFGISHYDD